MLATVDELMTYMDQSRFSNRQEEVAELVLVGLQSELETILRRPIEVDEYVEEFRVDETYLNGRNMFLPMGDDYMSYVEKPYPIAVSNSPVSGISQVRVKIYPGDGDWQVHEAGLDYTPRKWGLDLYRVGANDIVEVTYSGGLDGSAIAFLKLSILRAAAREMTNQVDDVVGLKDLQTNDVPQKQTGFTEEEIRVLNRWKRKQPALS